MLEKMEIREAQPRLKELVRKVHTGIEVLLTDGMTPLARLVPLTSTEVVVETPPATPVVEPTESRIAGLHAGAIWTSEDFDDPLPLEFWIGSE